VGNGQLDVSPVLRAWGGPGFGIELKKLLESLSAQQLRLQEGLTQGSHALDDDIEAVVLSSCDAGDSITASVSMFYTAIIAGCSCADDPTPLDKVAEHCVMLVALHKQRHELTIELVDEDAA